MFAISPQSNRVIWRPDFSVAKFTNGSENRFGQKAGSVTINSAVGVVCLLIPGHLPVCMSSRGASCTPSGVSNHPMRKRDVEQRETAEKKEMETMVSSLTGPAFNVACIFLNSSVSTFSRCIQMLLVMCNPLQVRVYMHDKE